MSRPNRRYIVKIRNNGYLEYGVDGVKMEKNSQIRDGSFQSSPLAVDWLRLLYIPLRSLSQPWLIVENFIAL